MRNERLNSQSTEINWVLCHSCKHKLFYVLEEASNGKVTICIKCPSCKKIQKVTIKVAEM